MSDSFISLVPSRIEIAGPEKVAEQIKHWLWNEGIISRSLSDCILGEGLGYAPGANYRDVLIDRDADNQVLELELNGLEIITERNIFHNAGNGLEEVICPLCGVNAHDSDWGDVVDEWIEGGDGLFECPNCKKKSLLSDYDFNAGEKGLIWAFSNLGLTFNNWPPTFNTQFLEQLERYYAAPVKIVYGRW